jgi:lysozyme
MAASLGFFFRHYGEFKPYVHLLHWQLTPYGRVRGIRTEVDVNVFNGNKEEFAKYVKGEM